jgi:putative flippase GtrA
MNMTIASTSRRELGQVARYVANGLAATAVHYGALVFGLEVLRIPVAGLANLLAAMVGITASFFGSRYFVFRRRDQPIALQAARFAGLYAAIACLHASVLGVWTDWWRLDWRIGFLIATGLQVAGSYWGNKHLVFRHNVQAGEGP